MKLNETLHKYHQHRNDYGPEFLRFDFFSIKSAINSGLVNTLPDKLERRRFDGTEAGEVETETWLELANLRSGSQGCKQDSFQALETMPW